MLIPIPKPNRAVQIAQGAARSATSAFDRAASALSLGSVGQAVARSADLATGGVVTRAQEILGVKSGPEYGAVGRVSGKVGGLASSVLRPSEGLSQWGNLSSKLIARMYALGSEGTEDFADGMVRGPITEVVFDSSFNWLSPFESTGPESKAPALMAMIQTGQIGQIANVLQASGLGSVPGVGEYLKSSAEKTKSFSDDLKGRTGITKLNSRQVFSGMPPIKITMVLHLRAMTDPQTQVMDPYQKLLEWAMPKELAEDGVIAELIRNGSNEFIKSMFPSRAPTMIGFNYANNRYSPMVIEAISNPLDGPMSPEGLPIYRAVQITLATLTALDRNDVAGIFSRS